MYISLSLYIYIYIYIPRAAPYLRVARREAREAEVQQLHLVFNM